MRHFHNLILNSTLATVVGLGSVVAFSTPRSIATEDNHRSRAQSIAQMSSEEENQDNMVAALSESGSFNTLAKAIEAADLTDTLQSSGQYTLFAPTDEAFQALPEGTLEALLKPENQDTLRRILQYHVVLGAADSSQIQSGLFETAEGTGVNIDVNSDAVMVEGAKVIQADIKASNGVIHAIDKVMLPPDISVTDLQ